MSLIGKILFADDSRLIFCGDKLNLLIEIENQEKVFVKEIFINFRGDANVKYEDLLQKSEDGIIIYIMQIFEGQQTLLNEHIQIQPMDALNKGKFIYNMQLNVPLHLPQSVNRKYGSIAYKLELGVSTATGVQMLYTLPLDIKECLISCIDKECVQPFNTVFKKSFCWGFCNFQPLKVTLTIPNTSFMPGQSVNYFLKMENFNKFLDVQRLSVVLTQTQHFKALKPKERTKQVHTTINKVMHLFYENHHNSKLEGSFELPQCLEPTSPKLCLLNTTYNLHFIIVFMGFQADGCISVPITVGSATEATEKIEDFKKYETRLQIEQDQKTEFEV